MSFYTSKPASPLWITRILSLKSKSDSLIPLPRHPHGIQNFYAIKCKHNNLVDEALSDLVLEYLSSHHFCHTFISFHTLSSNLSSPGHARLFPYYCLRYIPSFSLPPVHLKNHFFLFWSSDCFQHLSSMKLCYPFSYNWPCSSGTQFTLIQF